MEQSLGDQGDGEELIDTKVEGVHSTDRRQQPSQLCPYCVVWPIMLEISNFWTDRRTLMEQEMDRNWWRSKLEVCIRQTKNNGPLKYASTV